MPYSDDFILKYIATLDSSKYIEGLKGMQGQTENSTNKMNTSFKNLGKQIASSVATKMSLAGASVYVTRKFIQTTKEVANFHKQLSMVNTLLKVSKEELKDYGEKFEEIAIKVGVDKNEVVNAAYQSLSSGVAKKDLNGFLETASKTAVAGQATVEESVGVITSIINAYKMEMSEATNVADWLLSVQNKGVTTVKELGSQLGDVTSISSSLGITLNDLGGAIAQITQNGNNTAKTITMLKTMFSELSKEGQTASDNFKKISGQSFTEFIQNGGTLNEAMLKMEKYAKDSNISIVDLFSSVEAGSAALNLTGINADKFNEKIKDITKSSGELENAYKTATDNIYYEWKKLTEDLADEWNDFVKTVIESEALFNIVKAFRIGIEDKGSKPKTIDDYRNDLTNVSKELEETRANISKPQGRYRPDSSMRNLNNQAKEQELTKRRSEIIRKINELEKQAIEDKKVNINTEITMEDEKQKKLTELKSQEENRIKAHNESLSNSELNYLSKKKEYMSQQQDLLALGIISKDEYQRNLKIKDNELLMEQQKSNLETLKEMENFYRSIDDLAKANEFKKKVIEVEIQIKNREFSSENKEDLFLQAQEEQMKEHQTNMLADEWEYLTQLAEMRENSSLTETQIEEFKEERMRDLELKRLELESEQLQNRLNFYNSDEAYKQQAVDTLKKIEENALRQEEIRNKKDVSLSKRFSNLKTDILKRSKDTLLDTYDMVAKGQMKSLEDFKKFAALQLAEIMLSHGREAMIDGGKATVKAITLAATPGLRSQAPPLFAAAAKDFAFAAAMGVGANALYSSANESNSEDTDTRDNGRTRFDESIDSRVESAKKESEGTVYIDVSNSSLMKVLIKDIEKELKDGYNVTLIGKKKR